MKTKFLENRLKLDLNYFLSGGFWLFVGQAIAIVRSLVISVFLARSFSVSDFGTFGYITAVFTLANMFGASGMSIAITQSVARGFEGTFRNLLQRIFIISCLGSLLLIVWQLYFTYVQHGPNPYVFFVLAILFPLNSAGINYVYYLSAKKEFRLRTYYEAIIAIASLALGYGAYITWHSIYLVIIALFFVQGVFSCYYVTLLLRQANTKVDPEALAYGSRLNWNYVVPILKSQLDRILIASFLQFEQTALYNIAYSFSDQVTTAAKVFGTLLIPKSANLEAEEIRRRFRYRTIALACLLSIVGTGLLAIVIPPFIRIVYGERYSPAIPYAVVMLLFIPIRSLGIILRNVHESQKNTAILTFMSNHMAIIEILLMLFGMIVSGLWGLITAKIIADVISLIWQVMWFHKEEHSTIKSIAKPS